MVSSGNKKKRKNNHNNKKNKIKRANRALAHGDDDSKEPEVEHTEGEVAEIEQSSNKRNYTENDSDAEDQPKRKKKKKQPITTETDKKGKKSIRQMKREKFAQRQAEEAAANKQHLKSECLSYLSQWKHDKQNWKFMKAKQVWLFKNKFSSILIPDSSWPVFMEYFVAAQGNIRNLLLQDANKIIKRMDEWTEAQNSTEETAKNQEGEENEDGKTEEAPKPDDTTYKRARDLIQCLQE